MKLDFWYSLISRVFFVAAFLLLVLAVVEKLANASGQTLLQGNYTPGRLFEFAAILLLFVIALLLRGIRDELRKT